MSLNETPVANRIHIGIFGRRNVGKSSLINAITGQETALVSSKPGTTTDPVSKTMELLPLGPVVFIDTPGLDDDGDLGSERVRRALQVLDKIDMAVLVVDTQKGMGELERELIKRFEARSIKYITVYNKADISLKSGSEIFISAKTGMGINELRQKIGAMTPATASENYLVADFLKPNDIVILVTPIDSSAPKGRLILPQQQTIREILDSGAQAVITKEDSLSHTLSSLSVKPRLVITDSQVFSKVSSITPGDTALTSFSILFARKSGFLAQSVEALRAFDNLSDGDCILISEGCTHHRQCDDIGTVKMPKWILDYTKKNINFEFTGGSNFPENLQKYALIVHCGACMLNSRVMQARIQSAKEQNVPITNYGILIAHINGILKRAIEPLPLLES